MTTDTQENHMDAKKECWSADEENFRYDSLAELLDNHENLLAGNTVYVGEAHVPAYKQFCDADDVIQMMGERAYDIAGEYAEDFPDVTEEATAELNALLLAWMETHCPVNFWTVKNVKPYVITEADVAETQAQGAA